MPEQITPTTAPVIMGQAASVAIERLILAHLEGSDPDAARHHLANCLTALSLMTNPGFRDHLAEFLTQWTLENTAEAAPES